MTTTAPEPTALGLAVSDLAAARTAAEAARVEARRRLAEDPTEATAEALAAASTVLRLVENALAVATDVDVDDLADDPAVASWQGLGLALGRLNAPGQAVRP